MGLLLILDVLSCALCLKHFHTRCGQWYMNTDASISIKYLPKPPLYPDWYMEVEPWSLLP